MSVSTFFCAFQLVASCLVAVLIKEHELAMIDYVNSVPVLCFSLAALAVTNLMFATNLMPEYNQKTKQHIALMNAMFWLVVILAMVYERVTHVLYYSTLPFSSRELSILGVMLIGLVLASIFFAQNTAEKQNEMQVSA
jgi:branched-subunit amino acid permease